MLVNIPQCSDVAYNNYFLFSLSPLTKEELKAYQSLESYDQFTPGWVKEVKIFLNYLLKLPWLFYGSVRDAFSSPFYCSIGIGALCSLLRVNSQSARKYFTIQLLWAIVRLWSYLVLFSPIK